MQLVDSFSNDSSLSKFENQTSLFFCSLNILSRGGNFIAETMFQV